MNPVNRVYICDDDEGMRESLRFLLSQHDLEVLAFSDGPELLRALDASTERVRGVFLLDVAMEPMSGTELHDALIARGYQKRNPVVFLTANPKVSTAVEAVREKKAHHFLEKTSGADELVSVIREALREEAIKQREADRVTERGALLDGLAPQQRRVFVLMAAGLTEDEMSVKLQLSVSSIQQHKRAVKRKLGVATTAECATLLAEMRASGLEI